jgi:hypothetical protein
MAVGRTSTLLGRLYEHIELALWASLIAALVVFALFVLPGIPAAQQRAEAAQAAAFERECDFYCARWGMPAGTRRHAQCMSDLRQFRANVVKALAEDDPF